MQKYLKVFAIAIITIAIIFGIHTYRQDVKTVVQNLILQISDLFKPAPCSQPLRYSLGTISPDFGIATHTIKSYTEQSSRAWSDAIQKPLFEYVSDPSNADLTINFIYDYRQDVTVQLGQLGIVIKNDKETFEVLKTKYDSIFPAYEIEKQKIQQAIDEYMAEKEQYQKQVEYWNSDGGAPENEYKKIELWRIRLNEKTTILGQRQDEYNKMVDTLNSLVRAMNDIASKLNLSVKTYNTIGSSAGEEFSEGEYIQDESGTRINIYQFDNINQLIRVLEHEFGHALGLDHVEDSGSIMYRLNNGNDTKLSDADMIALRTLCEAK